MRDVADTPGITRPGWRLPTLAAMIFVVGVLLVFNLSTWRLVQDFQESKHADLIERLRTVGRTVGHDLQVPYPPVILDLLTTESEAEDLAAFAETQQYRELTTRLNNLQTINGLAQIVLLTPRGNVVADSTGESDPGAPNIWTIDRAQFQAAASGDTGQWLYYTLDEQPFFRVYVPLRSDSRIIAVLQVAARPDFLEELTATRRRTLVQSLISSALLVLIGWSIFRLFNYMVRLERTALQGARIEAMGALAGGIAHELRNPLSIIRVLTEELRQEAPPDSRIAQNANDIIGEVERLNEITTHFLSLSRAPDTQVRRQVDLIAELGRVVQLMRKTALAQGVRFETNLPSGELLVFCDDRAMRQVLLNVLINAAEALPPEGGMIKVSARDRRNAVEVKIVDNGRGIPKRDLGRVVEPFYTTKTMGTGLGLSVSRRIVEDAGGQLTIESSEGDGTAVTITLPAWVGSGNEPVESPQ